ncbi:MAG: UvrD-helicase domain-containing protein [Acidobacteriota bacterium]
MKQPSLFETDDDRPDPEPLPPDQAARDFAVDPRHDVVLEASAGTGKTRVLVDRYVRLLERGVDPRHILAITFTRKAAAEMRDRVIATLARRVESGSFSSSVWHRLRQRMSDIQISTIDAFCFTLLREFPLEADVDPAFEVADETEMARFAVEALDLTLRAARALVHDDETVRLLLVRVKTPVLRDALSTLIDRRQVGLPAVASFVKREPGPPNAAEAGARFVRALQLALASLAGRTALLVDGPTRSPEFEWLSAELAGLDEFPAGDPVRVQHLRRRLEAYFLTQKGEPRQRLHGRFTPDLFPSADARKSHQKAVAAFAPHIVAAMTMLDRDLDRLLARGLLRLLVLAVQKYEGLLAEHALLDFPDMLDRAVALLERQEEFARSRLKLQARYHHLLVDEFQDTSRRQWRLIDLLIAAWAEGEGVADADTSVFVVGDRKQSIYRFRHAEVTLLDEAARRIGNLRPGRTVRQAITTSFRAVPELLAFVNTLAAEMVHDTTLDERWTYGDQDRFPVPAIAAGARRDGRPVLGIIAQPTMQASAAAVADEVARLLLTAVVRDRKTGARPARPEDIAILFRARAGHQYFEDALEARGIRTYVYKGLGFFDAPEVQDLQALIRFLAQPDSDLRAAEFLRSRFVRLADEALARLAPAFSRALIGGVALDDLGVRDIDADLLRRARQSVASWLHLADRVPPSELLDIVLRESAYVFETRGRRLGQARENVKKVRALVRRVESRGYATLGRLARYFDTLRGGDDSNAIVEAADAVNLMTIHAAKGLEFPIVFVVNLHASGRGRGGGCTVIERGPDGEPEVTFGSTEATALEERRDLEELRRLIYVAATRARDRVYLAAEVDAQGRLRRGARSLASLLPASLTSLFTMAAAGGEVEWHTSAGTFAFDVCRPCDEPLVVPAVLVESDSEPDAIVPELSSSGQALLSATTLVSEGRTEPAFVGTGGGDRLVGTVVHRMFQRRVDADQLDEDLYQAASRLMRPIDLVDVDDPRATAVAAASAYRALRGRADVATVLASGACHYEVPVSFVAPGKPDARVRGTVDCLVAGTDGTLTVLEFKTGRPRPEHERQVALYAQALEAAFGAGPVRPVVFYP